MTSWYDAIADIAAGDVVCRGTDGTDSEKAGVLPASTEALKRAGLALGVAVSNARPGDAVKVVESGYTGAARGELAGGQGPSLVGVSPSGRCVRLAARTTTDHVVGVCTAEGELTVRVSSPLDFPALVEPTVSAELQELREQVQALLARLEVLEAGGGDAPIVQPEPVVEPPPQPWPALSPGGKPIPLPFASKLHVRGDMTVETWVYLDALPDPTEQGREWATIYFKHNEAEGWLYVDGYGKLWMALGSSGCSDRFAIAEDLTVPVGAWVHVAVVVERTTGTLRFYLDGQQSQKVSFRAANRTSEGQALGAGAFTDGGVAYIQNTLDPRGCAIGAYPSGYRPMQGRLAELRVWRAARTTDEIRGAMSRRLTDAERTVLVAYWRMDEGSGATLRDSSGNGLDVPLPASATWAEGPTHT